MSAAPVRRATRARDEAGVAFPSPVVMLSVIAVAMAGITFVATRNDDGREPLTTVSRPAPTSTPVTPPPAQPQPKPEKPAVKRSAVQVEVYNNSGVKGLAGRTAGRASAKGWDVVGSDNWVGTIPAPTIYYPAKLKAAAQLLSRDLGITRLRPATDPMRMDRLTVILTSAYS